MANTTPKVLVTLQTACGCTAQGFLGTDKALTWDSEPDHQTLQAIFTRIDVESLDVVEVVAVTGDDWREFESTHAEAALLANVANGHTLAQALELVPSGI